jgi:hypothetical protein
MKIQLRIIIAFFLILTISSCREYASNGDEDRKSSIDEPVLIIEAVSNKRTGAGIQSVNLRDFVVKNRPIQPAHFFVQTPNAYRNIVLNEQDNSIACTLPCGLGFEMGEYQFRMSAIGFKDTSITINATFATITPVGLGFRASGGTRVKFEMTPQ